MEADSVGIIAILSMSYIITRIVKKYTSVAKIPRAPVENHITTLSVVKVAIKFSSCGTALPTSRLSTSIKYLRFQEKYKK